VTDIARRLLSVALAPLIFAVIGGWACYASAGASLGLFLAVPIIVTLLAPPLTVAEGSTANRLIVLGAIVGPLCLFWLPAIFHGDVRFAEWLASCLVMIAYAAALAGLSAALCLATRSAIVSAALSVIVGLVWLTWPIWASRTWNAGASEAAVARGVVCHPALAINGQVSRGLGNWTEQPVAYHLTELSQSVNFILPRTVWPCVLLHGLIGASFLILAQWAEARRVPSSEESAAAEAAAEPNA
jgi:hypothetical protein